MYVEIDYGNGRQRASFKVHVTPETSVPARFTGNFREEVEDGSLVVYAEVDVTEPGHYVVDANCFDSGDRPVAWTRFKGLLDAGRNEARLVIAGNVLHDRAAVAPFVVRDLRGVRVVSGSFPDTEAMAAFSGSHRTGDYELAAFSSDDWTDEHKQATLRKMIEARHTGTGPDVFAAQPQ